MGYWNDQRWKSIHSGAKTVNWFFTGDKLFQIFTKNGKLIFEWQRNLKNKVEQEYNNHN